MSFFFSTVCLFDLLFTSSSTFKLKHYRHTKCCCCLVTKLCMTLCNFMDCSRPGSSVHGISQARILEWVAISFSRGIFLTQESNPLLLSLQHCRQTLHPLSYLGQAHNQASQVTLVVKNPPANSGDIRGVDSIPKWGRIPGGRHGNPLQYSCLDNPHGQRGLVGHNP